MNIAQRSIYFLIGLFLGCLIVYFIAQQKNIRFPYGPNARTLSSILSKKYRIYSEEVLQKMQENKIDSLKISQMIFQSEVHFSKSKTAAKLPCQEYFLESHFEKKQCDMVILRCDSVAKIIKLTFKK